MAVQAGWRDRADLLGYYNAFEKRFYERNTLQALYRAQTEADRDRMHIVLLDAASIHNTFYEVMQREGWSNGLPTNTLLISGPSKTADIQVTLAYGAHGPKELVVLLIGDEA